MYEENAPDYNELLSRPGSWLVEFGADWCGYCQALQPEVQRILADHPQVRHLKIADGKGKPLGRAFKVKLWPNFVFIKDGSVLWQLARPTAEELQARLLT